MVNMDMLHDKMAIRRMTNEELAGKLGVNVSTLYRKIKSNGLTFTVGQMHRIVEVLSLTPDEAKQIFLQ